MDETDRATITHNLVELTNQTNLDEILPKLMQKGVFSAMMIEKYKDANTSLMERKRELFLDLQRRGPDAFHHLVASLLETGHLELVRLLRPDFSIEQYFVQRQQGNYQNGAAQLNLPGMEQEQANNLASRLETLGIHRFPYSAVSLGTTPLKVEVTRATQRKDRITTDGLPVYPMGSKPRGYFLMVNNVQFVNNIEKTRIGSEVDEQNLRDLFEQLGFIVETYRDLGFEDMKRKIKEFASRPQHSRCDCCVVAIMSHGREGNSRMDSTILSVDGQLLPTDWVVEQFSGYNAPHLIRRPKIFFFQSCRGDGEDFGVKILGGRIQPDGHGSVVAHSMSDILIGYSTLPGFKSNRDVHLGTWYIQAICEVFMKYAHYMDIEDMLKMVNHKVESLKSDFGSLQTSTYENRGFRKLYFNPGLYDDPSVNPF